MKNQTRGMLPSNKFVNFVTDIKKYQENVELLSTTGL